MADAAHLPTSLVIGYSILCCGLVVFAGLMSGLTLGLLSLDRLELEARAAWRQRSVLNHVLKRSGTAVEKYQANAVLPLVQQGQRLLVTLLLMNAAAMETLPIFLDKLVNPVGAILISVTMVLIFGEIVPQAVCQRFGLAVGCKLRYLVVALMLLASPVSIPLAKLLDYLLGADEHGGLFRRAQLKALVDIHGRGGGHGGDLTMDETTIISGALDMSHKRVADAMTAMARVTTVSLDTPLTWPALRDILSCGHSRLPVHKPGEPTAIVGLLLVKELFAAVTLEDLTPTGAAPPARPRTIQDAIRLRPVPQLNRETPLFTVLNYFQTGRSHMAVVVPGPTVLYLDEAHGHGHIVGGLTRTRSGSALTAAAAASVPAEAAAAAASKPVANGKSPPLPGAGPVAAPGTARRSIDLRPPLVGEAPIVVDVAAARPVDNPALGVLGIITLEDVLEELLQEEILDETDRAEGDELAAAEENDKTLADHLHPSHPPPPPPPDQENAGGEGAAGGAVPATPSAEVRSFGRAPLCVGSDADLEDSHHRIDLPP